MKRCALVFAACALVVGVSGLGAQQPSAAAPRDLVGTWTLASVEHGLDGGTPTIRHITRDFVAA